MLCEILLKAHKNAYFFKWQVTNMLTVNKNIGLYQVMLICIAWGEKNWIGYINIIAVCDESRSSLLVLDQ